MSGRILVVDDSLTVRMDLLHALEGEGYSVTLAKTLGEARLELARTRPDLVVLDVTLPDGDGVDLLRELRATPADVTLPVILLSSQGEVEDRLRGIAAGAHDYAAKPYDRGYLLSRIRMLLPPELHPVGRSRVLIVEDSLTFRHELRAALEAAGYEVLECASGEEGVRLAARERPDAVIVDGLLEEGIDGPEVIQRLRLDPALRETRFLLLTASLDRTREAAALAQGADATLRKDAGFDLVLARLSALLRGRPVEERPQSTSLFGPKRVLAVATQRADADEMLHGLRGDDYDIVVAGGQEAARALLSAQPVDCVLLIGPPRTAELEETLAVVRGSPAWRDMPVLVLHREATHDAMRAAIEAGADDCLAGPADLALLGARVLAQLRRKQLEVEARRIRDELHQRELELAQERARAEERAALARELQAQNQALSAQNVQLEERLRQAQRLESLGRLAAGVAHDFNNMLGVMLGYVELMRAPLPAEHPDVRRLDGIRAAGARAVELTQKLLTFGRRQQLKPERVVIADLITEVTPLLERGVGASVRLELESRGGSHQVDVDRSLLEQALVNLAINARDAMPGGGRLSVVTSSSRIDDPSAAGLPGIVPGDYVVIEVRDTGEGMAPETVEHAFEPFFTTKPVGQGTGLGLASVHGFVTQSGGAITIDSERGVGTCFTIYLPRAA